MIFKPCLNLQVRSLTHLKGIWLLTLKVRNKLCLKHCSNISKMIKSQNLKSTTRPLFSSTASKVQSVEPATSLKVAFSSKSLESSRKCSTFTVSAALINQKEQEISLRRRSAGSSTQANTARIS